MAATRVVAAAPASDRLARAAERVLRALGDGRTGLVLLLLTGTANAGAALVADGPSLLAGPAYAVLLGALALSAVAAVAVRAPTTWREWRRPGPVRPGPGALAATVSTEAASAASVEDALVSAGYRVRRETRRGTWAVHGVRRGWARYAGHLVHLALVVIVLGAAIGAAFGSETTFSLFTGDGALLDDPRPGFSSAVRLESFEAEFGADDRPRRLDTVVTFLRDGERVEPATLRVNEPGAFDGYLVHPWTYGPAVRLRVTTLGGATLLDAPVALDDERNGVPVGAADLPTVGLSLGLALVDATRNELGVSAVGAGGLDDTARLTPGESARLGPVVVELERFDAWVTFLSRRDPGLLVLFAGGASLCAGLAVGFWMPRRRVTVAPVRGDLRVVLRGERFDRPASELERLVIALRETR